MLRTLLPKAAGESRRVVLVGGEPGSGKTRLVREFAADAARDGALVLYGACHADVHTPYGAFAQAFRRLARILDPDELRAALGDSGGELTRLLPELPAWVDQLPPPVRADPDTERHRLHTTVRALLQAVSRQRPVLLVIEDGHWADATTLLLLRHLARSVWGGRVLLFATFRDTEADVPEALAETLADLRRADDVVRLRLAGLSDDEVSEFVVRSAAGTLGPDLEQMARTISDLTGGNAFLVCELWRALVETRMVEVLNGVVRINAPFAELGTPESVREVVSQRLARLAPTTTELLELAAAAGTEFELEIIRRGSGLDERELVTALDEAVRSGFVEELPRTRLAHRFAHELVRRAVYGRLTRVRRAELHLRVGEALEAAMGDSVHALPDLAHHFAAAVPLGDTHRAIEYSVRAAQAATEALAFDEATDLLQTALDLGIQSAADRAEVLLQLGTIRHRAGKAFDALDAFRAAAEIARDLQDAELLARAAIGYEDAGWRPGPEHRPVGLLEEAAAALGDRPSELRVQLLAGLARALDMLGQHDRAAVVRTSAIALARQLDDRAGLAVVLMRSYWSRGSIPVEQSLDMLAEARVLGEELGDPEIQAEAISWIVPAHVAVAAIPPARAAIAELRDMAQITAQPFYLHVAEHYGAALALCEGRLDAADAMARRSEEAGRMLTGRDASGTYGIQMFTIRREQGRLAELAPVIRILAGGRRAHGPWRPGLACLLVELGMEAEGRRELDRIRAAGLDPFRESLWLASLVYLTDACAVLRDEALAAELYTEMVPLTGRNVMIGHLVVCYGAADRYLGMLASTLGEWERAEEHFNRAIALNRQMGMDTWLAHTEYEYGRMLLARSSADRSRAETHLSHAAELAAHIGMRALSNRIDALGAQLTPAGFPDELSGREVEILALVARGMSNREIGSALFISAHTAANHIRSILRKTGCSNRTEAASYAHRHGLAASESHG